VRTVIGGDISQLFLRSNVFSRISQGVKAIVLPVTSLLFFLFIQQVSFGQTATSTWTLTSNADAIISGNISSGAMTIGSGISNLTFSGTGANSTSWESGASINLNDYYEFTISPLSGYILNISDIQFDHERSRANGGNDGGPTVGSVYYSTNGFSSSTQIGSNFTVNTGSTTFSVSGLSIAVPDGSTLTIRIYGWNSENSNGRYSILNLVLSGITIIAAPPSCTTSISPTDGETNVSVDGTLSWSAFVGSTGYYLYFGTDASATNIENGTDLGNVTSYTPSSNLDFLTDYYWRVVPYNSFGSASGCSTWNFTTADISYCLAGSTAYDLYESITNVTFAGIDNSSPASKTTGYTDYTTLVSPAEVMLGQSYPIAVTDEFVADQYGGYCKVYIDLNQDGVFDEASELMFGSSYSGNQTMSGSISIPLTAITGTTRMRVIIEGDADNTGALPCGSFTWGEAEDYAVNISSPCTSADVPVLSSAETTVCRGSDVTVSITGNLNDATEWIIYTGSCGGTPITSTSTNSFIINGISATTTYYVRGEGSSCDDLTCGNITITVEDITAPVPDNATLPDVTAECSVTSLNAPTATDNCVGLVTGTHDVILPITTQGTTIVTWTYDDGNGNTSTQTQNVIIDDVTDPIFTCPSATTVVFNASCQVAIPDLVSGITDENDNCGTPTLSQSPVAGTVLASGAGTIHHVTITADDENGNLFSCDVEVTGVPANPIDIEVVDLDNSCQSGETGSTTTVTWDITKIAGTDVWTFDYEIKQGVTTLASGNNVSAIGNTQVTFIADNETSQNKTYTLTISNVKDECGVGEINTTNNSDSVTLDGLPNTSDINTN